MAWAGSRLVRSPTPLGAGLLVLLLAGCEEAGDPGTKRDGSFDQDAGGEPDAWIPPPPTPECASVPRAYVFDHVDPWTKTRGAADRLRAAGFEVEELPLDRSPRTLAGLVFFASFASESPEYRAYASTYAADLQGFVEQGNAIVQMAQSHATEPAPPFLPPGLEAVRSKTGLDRVYAIDPEQELLVETRVRVGSGSWDTERYLTWEAPAMARDVFARQRGFEIVLAESARGRSPVLLEARHGKGRIVLVASSFDKPQAAAPEGDAFARTFFRNLTAHVSRVCRGLARAPRVMPSHEEAFVPGGWLLAALPDTQYYASYYPSVFARQTEWLSQNAARLGITYVVHLGDITDSNSDAEWRVAQNAFSRLDGVVPYALVGGNHDYGPRGNSTTRDTLLNSYIPYENTARLPTFGGAFEAGKLDSTYHLFSAGGRDFILFALEWAPRDEVVAWADSIAALNPDRLGILVTHAYLNWDDKRLDFARDPQDAYHHNPHISGTPGTINDGEELWQKLVRKHRFAMVLSGHVLADGVGFLTSTTDRGNRCYQMLSNYQVRPGGGNGYMRLLEFLPHSPRVRVFTFSPVEDAFYWDDDQFFTVELD